MPAATYSPFGADRHTAFKSRCSPSAIRRRGLTGGGHGAPVSTHAASIIRWGKMGRLVLLCHITLAMF
jgi:hypothetical protein